MDKMQNGDVLSLDELQPTEYIADVLKQRTRPVSVAREINPNLKYTIEGIYQNELIHQKAQALANLDREMVFIDEQIDKAMNKGEKDKNIYLKENDTRSYFDKYAIQEINKLLDKMKDHSLYVKVDYLDDGLKLSAETQEKVMRDGIPQIKIRYVRPIELSKDLVEGNAGYRLSIKKMRGDEEAFHDPIVIKMRKQKEAEKNKKTDEEQNEQVKQKEEQKPQKPEPVAEPEPVATQPEPTNQQADVVVEDLKTLDPPAAQAVQPEPAQPQPVVPPQDDIDYVSLISNELMMELLHQVSPQENKAPEVSAVQQEQPTVVMPQPAPQPTVVQQPPKQQLLMTEHEMKMSNFRRAADEVKAKIIALYNGDEKRAAQDPTYLSLQKFVGTTIEKQSQVEDHGGMQFDWNDPNYASVMQRDYQNKVQAFAKKYDDNTFNQVQDRANNPF